VKKIELFFGFYLTVSDDGYSGVDFDNRPGFQKILAEVKAGRVGTIITKDYCAIMGLNQRDLETQGILA